MEKTPLAKPAIDAIRGRGPLSHSPLYWWMWDHFDEVQSERTGRADWITAAARFSEMGFKGRKGASLNPENVRKTWARVVRDKRQSGSQPVQNPKPKSKPQSQSAAINPPVRVLAEPKPAQSGSPVLDNDARDRIEKLRREMAKRSGRSV